MSSPELVLTSAIPGDTIITVSWVLNNITGYKPVAMKFYINDVNANPYAYSSSLKWSEVTVPTSIIKNNMFDIPNLLNGTAYVFYGFIILQSISSPTTFVNVNSKVSSDVTIFGATEIIPFAKPPALILDDGKTAFTNKNGTGNSGSNYSGADPTSTTEYNLRIILNNFFSASNVNNYVPDSIIVMTKDNNSNPAASETREFPPILWQTVMDGKETDAFGNISYIFRMTDLEPNLTYEVSTFAIKNNSIGTLSNTILAVATQRASPPQAPTFLIQPDTGNVKITTTITERGATSDIYYLNLYKRTGAGTVQSPYIYTQIVKGTTTKTVSNAPTVINYTFDLSSKFSDQNESTKMVFPYEFKFNTVTDDLANDFDPFDSDNSIFPYGVQQTICFTVYNKFGENPKESGNFATFTPYKKVSAPSIRIGLEPNSITTGTVDLNVTSVPTLYGQTINKYRVYTKRVRSETVFNFKSEYDPVSTQLYTVSPLDSADKYYFAVSIAIYNNNYTSSVNIANTGPEYIESNLSTDVVYATPFRPASAPVLTISYLEADVNGQAKLTWTPPTNIWGLSVVKYNIYRKLAEGNYGNTPLQNTNLSGTDFIYTDTGLTNGTRYEYIVSAVTSTAGTTSATPIEVEGYTSVSTPITPWSRPSVATLSITDTGNHWARMTITNNATSANGLTFYQYKVTNTNLASPSVSVADKIETVTTFYYTGLPNDVVNTFKPYVLYNNPNTGGYITTSEPSPVDATPSFQSITKFEPSSIILGTIGSNSVSLTWTAPTFYTNGAGSVPDNVSLNGYKVAVYLSSDTTFSTVKYLSNLLTSATSSLDITNSALINGNTYVARIIAYYDDSTTTGTVEQLEKYSLKSLSFTPVTNPNPPTNVTYSDLGTSRKVTVNWTAPAYTQGSDNNNLPIYQYQIAYQEYEYNGTTLIGSKSAFQTTNTTSYSFTGLNNGKKYKFFVTTQIQNPNNTSILLTSSEATNATLAVPFDNTNSLYAVAGFAISSISGTSIGIGWTPNSSLAGLPFNYLLEKSSDLGANWSTLSTIASTASTSVTDSAVTIGTLYQYRIHIEMPNPNGGSDLVGPLSSVIDAKPYLAPDAPTGLTVAASDSSVGLSWTTASIVNGLPVQGYNVYTVVTGSPNTYTKIGTLVTSGTFSHTGLTNGTLYKYVYTVVTQDTNNDLSDPNAGQNIESGYSSMVSATPYKAPAAPVVTVDITDATSGTNTINWSAVTNTGGFPIAGYNVYRVVSGTPTKLNTSGLVTNVYYSHTGLTNGTSYSYIVRAVVLNTNASSAQVESVDSNTVTKIPFTYANAASLSYTESNETDIVLNWTFTNNSVASGLPSLPAPYFNINVTNNSQPELNYVVGNVSISDTSKNFHITPGNRYSFTMDTVYSNPNDTSLKVTKVGTVAQSITTFGYADVHLDVVQTDLTTIKFAINQLNDIDLKGGVFSNYFVYVYAMNADNTYSTTPVKTLTVNQQVPPNQTITGLTAYKLYKIVVQVETYRQTTPSDIHRGDNTYLLATTNPSSLDPARPVIDKVFNQTNTPNTALVRVALGGDNVYPAINQVIFVISKDNSSNANKQVFYSVTDPYVSATGSISIPLNNINYSDIDEVSVVVYNYTHGMSDLKVIGKAAL